VRRLTAGVDDCVRDLASRRALADDWPITCGYSSSRAVDAGADPRRRPRGDRLPRHSRLAADPRRARAVPADRRGAAGEELRRHGDDKVLKLRRAPVGRRRRRGVRDLQRCDDHVSNALARTSRASRGNGGTQHAAFYTYGGRVMRLHHITHPGSGPCVIVRADLLTYAQPPFAGAWADRIIRGGNRTTWRFWRRTSARSTSWPRRIAYYHDYMREMGHPLAPLPFAGNVVINHGDSMSTSVGPTATSCDRGCARRAGRPAAADHAPGHRRDPAGIRPAVGDQIPARSGGPAARCSGDDMGVRSLMRGRCGGPPACRCGWSIRRCGPRPSTGWRASHGHAGAGWRGGDHVLRAIAAAAVARGRCPRQRARHDPVDRHAARRRGAVDIAPTSASSASTPPRGAAAACSRSSRRPRTTSR